MFTSLILALAVAAPGVKTEPKKDPPTVVGKWVPETAVGGGKPDNPPAGSTIEFSADGKCVLTEGAAGKPEESTYKADPKKDPAEIDITEPGSKDKLILGIYKIDGDVMTLAIAMGGVRPTAFESPAGSQVMLITLKRHKKD